MIESWFHQILHVVSSHPIYGLIFAFLISFGESLPIIGTILPGSVTMTAVGTLIGAHALPLYATLFWASAGAFSGDCIGYFLGKYYGDIVRKMWPFSRYPGWIEKGETFFRDHGGKSILIGRFVGPVRSTIPLIAGILQLSTSRFLLAAIPSAISWALAYMLPGIILGALSLDVSPKAATQFVITGLILIVIGWFIFWLIYRLGHSVVSFFNQLFKNQWVQLRTSRPLLHHALNTQSQHNEHLQLGLASFAILCFTLFIAIFLSVITHSGIQHLNQPIHTFLFSFRCSTCNAFMVMATMLGDKPVIFSFALLAIAWLLWQKQTRSAAYVAATAFTAAAITGICKLIYHSPRPTGIVNVASSSSFPSGHTLLVVVILGFICYLSTRNAKAAYRYWTLSLYCIAVAIVASSRLVLGAHWFCDILASITLGLSILLFSILLYRRRSPLPCQNQPWISSMCLALLLPWIIYGSWKYQQTLSDYTPVYKHYDRSFEQWWQNPTKDLPAFKDNRFGHISQPFNIQWLGHLTQIRATLKASGWTAIDDKHKIRYNIKRLNSHQPNRHLPILPKLYQGKAPAIIFFTNTLNKNKILQLVLWRAPIRLTDYDLPLWIGSLSYHRTVSIKYLQYSKQIYSTPTAPQTQLLMRRFKQLNLQTKLYKIKNTLSLKQAKHFHWSGYILMLAPTTP